MFFSLFFFSHHSPHGLRTYFQDEYNSVLLVPDTHYLKVAPGSEGRRREVTGE